MNKGKKRSKRIRNLVAICTLCAILLTVSTYAWFIGMKTVNVKPFEIKIATTEGLFLSMDGYKWTYNIDVTDTTNFPAYVDNTNYWAPGGLIPVSTVGDMDSTVSRMKLYEKGSLTTTTGGYRLLTSRVDNNTAYVTNANAYHQGKGYVVFDLFVKNLSGEKYYATNDVENEEAVYLQTNSEVKVGSHGKAGTGIENSVRVAFTQIGRVVATTGENATAATDDIIKSITQITCSDSTIQGVDVTGICRDATIWEPNDTKHVQNALNWYDTSCRKRKYDAGDATVGADVTEKESYDKNTHCGSLNTTTAYPTYVISKEIGVSDNVDVYDGSQYNGYLTSVTNYADYVTAGKTGAKLVNFDYFTDTEKLVEGKERPQFMSLAPNSITKLRIYIYIEGQDIDNYDFASLGEEISVNFGFTKERYNPEDISYVGPELPETANE